MAQRLDLIIDQGATFTYSFDLVDSENNPDLTEYTPTMVMRKHFTSSNSYTFTTSLSGGTLEVSMSAANTANVPAGRYVYDIELTNGAVVQRYREGVITVTPEVGR